MHIVSEHATNGRRAADGLDLLVPEPHTRQNERLPRRETFGRPTHASTMRAEFP